MGTELAGKGSEFEKHKSEAGLLFICLADLSLLALLVPLPWRLSLKGRGTITFRNLSAPL